MTIYSYGVDLKSSFEFVEGDLKLSEYENNIGQAIGNRLNTIEGSLNLFYREYGSFFTTFLGWRKTDDTLRFMKVELDNTLKKDPRINNFTTELSFNDEGNVMVNIILLDFVERVDLNYVLNENGVVLME